MQRYASSNSVQIRSFIRVPASSRGNLIHALVPVGFMVLIASTGSAYLLIHPFSRISNRLFTTAKLASTQTKPCLLVVARRGEVIVVA